MAETRRADELSAGDRIVLWVGPDIGEIEAKVNDINADGTGFLLVEVLELDWAELRVRAAEPVRLAD